MCLSARADATCIDEVVVLAYSVRKASLGETMIARAPLWCDVGMTFLDLTAMCNSSNSSSRCVGALIAFGDCSAKHIEFRQRGLSLDSF